MLMYKTQIATQALARLGDNLKIVNLDDDTSIKAKTIREFFETSLATVLEAHDWSFASISQAMALHSDVPMNGFRFQYTKPADAQVVREVARDGIFPNTNLYLDQVIPFGEVLVGASSLILTNVPNAHARYTASLDPDAGMPVYFGRALSAQLSIDVGPSLIGSNFAKIESLLNSRAANELSKAIASDLGRQPQKQDSASPFVRARL